MLYIIKKKSINNDNLCWAKQGIFDCWTSNNIDIPNLFINSNLILIQIHHAHLMTHYLRNIKNCFSMCRYRSNRMYNLKWRVNSDIIKTKVWTFLFDDDFFWRDHATLWKEKNRGLLETYTKIISWVEFEKYRSWFNTTWNFC